MQYDHESHAIYALLLTSSYCLLEFAITRIFTFTTKYHTVGIDQTDLICALAGCSWPRIVVIRCFGSERCRRDEKGENSVLSESFQLDPKEGTADI
jgi:hypothetical protein